MSASDPTLLTVNFKLPWMFYIAFAAGASLIIRVILSVLRAVEYTRTEWLQRFWVAFRGYGESGAVAANDYWQTFLLGLLEICTFPALIVINTPQYIGGWLVLKTLPQWKHWSNKRNVYTRFLIGNAGVLIVSWLMAKIFF